VLCCDLVDISRNPIITIPIKKRISTEVLIYGKWELYIHKGPIKNDWRTSEREVDESGHQMPKIGGNKNQ